MGRRQRPVRLGDPDVYIVEKVLAKRKEKGRIKYYVKWEGFGPEYNEWVEASQVTPGVKLAFQEEEARKKEEEAIREKQGLEGIVTIQPPVHPVKVDKVILLFFLSFVLGGTYYFFNQ